MEEFVPAVASRPCSSRRRRGRQQKTSCCSSSRGMIAGIGGRARRSWNVRAAANVTALSKKDQRAEWRALRLPVTCARARETTAYYEVVEAKAGGVRLVYERLHRRAPSIGAITRLLNERGVPTSKQGSRMGALDRLGRVAQSGLQGASRASARQSCVRRQRITRATAQACGSASRDSASHERPRADWIEIPVPAIISEDAFRPWPRSDCSPTRRTRRVARPEAQHRERPGLVQQMRLRADAHLDALDSTQDPLLSLPRLGCWRHLGGAVLRQSPRPSGPARCCRLA